ncbi:MAG: peptidase [Candidatus Saccharibacteria bacterium]|nr:peptidase [Candidatus Saccharibacteria bacterium]
MKDLVLISDYMPDAIFDIRYATTHNITGKAIYQSPDVYLSAKAVAALQRVVDELKSEGFRLVVWDAYRPTEAQELLRKVYADKRYVRKNSIHSQGLAVDVTLASTNGDYLDMGTDFDEFSERAHPDATELTEEQLQNRTLLADVMTKHGFKQWPYEWWHFDFVG